MHLSLFKFIGFLVCTTHLALAGNIPPIKESAVKFSEERHGPRYSINNAIEKVVDKDTPSNQILRTREIEDITYTSYRTPAALEVDKVENLYLTHLFSLK